MNQLISFVGMMQPQGESANPLSTFLPLVLIIVVFYFFMIRPQVKRQKELRNFRNSLAKGDKVITTGGIYGKITAMNEDTISLEISDNVIIKIDKNAVLKDPADLQNQQK
ncbi:MAG: preprotein translocase subunit YajC [Bacteroidota bacterium]|nr:MAG: preprotein translocase subunit YajC [Bacteroidota bacterium]